MLDTENLQNVDDVRVLSAEVGGAIGSFVGKFARDWAYPLIIDGGGSEDGTLNNAFVREHRRPMRRAPKEILPRQKLIAFSRHRMTSGTKFFEEAERKGLEGIMAKRAESRYVSGGRTTDWLKIKTAKRQEVVIAGFTAPKRSRPFFGALVLALRENNSWRYIGHVGTGSVTRPLRICTANS